MHTREAIRRAGSDLVTLVTSKTSMTARSKASLACGRVLRSHPFSRVFSDIRKELIISTVDARAKQLAGILKGEVPDAPAC